MKSLRRWIATKGLVGEVPPWYTLIQASRYLKVPPWELAQHPVWWVNVALAAQGAEAAAGNAKKTRKAAPDADGGGTRRPD